MQRTLLLMRHAKADWSTDANNDFDRPLTIRGNKDAPKIGHWIQEHDWAPDRAICSTAKRAMQTMEHVRQSIVMEPGAVDWDEKIYEASLNQLITVLRETDSSTERLLMIGHNPAFSKLLNYLCPVPSHFTPGWSMPTAALAVIAFKSGWANIKHGSGEILSLTLPRALAD